jgi:hypothetical protein
MYRKLNLQKKSFANSLLAKTISKNSKKIKTLCYGLLAKTVSKNSKKNSQYSLLIVFAKETISKTLKKFTAPFANSF